MNSTGAKLNKFEQDAFIKSFFEFFEKPGKISLDQQALSMLKKFFEALKEKSKDAVSPISGTSYGAIMVFQKGEDFFIHSGANIDPEKLEYFQSPEHRNCAETQAAVSAQNHNEYSKDSLKYIFLYRDPKASTKLEAKKLLPCKDCFQRHLYPLIEAKGKLVIFSDVVVTNNFFKEGQGFDNSLLEIEDFFFKVFSYQEIPYLDIENELGSRVLSS